MRGLRGWYGLACALAVLAAVVPLAMAETPAPSGMAGKLVKHYHMQTVPQEGPWFSSTYTSNDQLEGGALPSRYGGQSRAAGSAIVVVETARDFSAMHRLQTDEVWHFYGGSPLVLLLLYPDGHGQSVTLGANVLSGELTQFTVLHGVWQGSAPRSTSASAYSFVGTQLAPGFDYADFEIGYRDDLTRRYPAYAGAIARLTRAEFAVTPAKRADQASVPTPRASVFSTEDVPPVVLSPGVTLEELVGRVAAKAKTSAVSVARFELAPGRSSDTSFNHHSQEIFLVVDGAGVMHLADKTFPVSRDSTVFIPAGVAHSIEADPNTLLAFYAISAPAYSPDDYVLVNKSKQ